MGKQLDDALKRFAKQYNLEAQGVREFYDKIPEELRYKWQDVMRDVLREIHTRELWKEKEAKDGPKESSHLRSL